MTKSFEALPVDAQLRKFRRLIAFRNVREWVACAIVAMAFGAMAAGDKPVLARVFSAEIVLAACYIAWRLYRDGRIQRQTHPSTIDPRDMLVGELTRQADLLAAVPRWYVAPLAFGWAGLQVAKLLDRPFRPGDLGYFAGGILLGLLIVAANLHGARQLRAHARSLSARRT